MTGRVSIPLKDAILLWLLSVSRSYDWRTYDYAFNFPNYFWHGEKLFYPFMFRTTTKENTSFDYSAFAGICSRRHWCLRWESNPQNLEFESSTYANSITQAYKIAFVCSQTTSVSGFVCHKFQRLDLLLRTNQKGEDFIKVEILKTYYIPCWFLFDNV